MKEGREYLTAHTNGKHCLESNVIAKRIMLVSYYFPISVHHWYNYAFFNILPSLLAKLQYLLY